MPVFEYKCGKCGRICEFLETSSSAVEKSCPHCGSKELEKQFSMFAPRVKEGASKRCSCCSDQTCPHSGHQH